MTGLFVGVPSVVVYVGCFLLLEYVHHLKYVLTACLEECVLFLGELELEYFLDAFLAEYYWYAEVAVVDAIFALELNAAREYALLVFDDGLNHCSC